MFVNIVAVLWGRGMAINLAWPREAVYGAPWYDTWGAFVYIAVILGAGLWWYPVKGCHHIGTLGSHTLPTNAESRQAEGCRDIRWRGRRRRLLLRAPLFVKDNIVTYTYNAFDENYYRIRASKPLAVGRVVRGKYSVPEPFDVAVDNGSLVERRQGTAPFNL